MAAGATFYEHAARARRNSRLLLLIAVALASAAGAAIGGASSLETPARTIASVGSGALIGGAVGLVGALFAASGAAGSFILSSLRAREVDSSPSDAGEKRLRMWCGAASSGQEPYTVLMVLAEKFPELAGWNIEFLATDISSEMVAKCNAGRYSQLEMNRGMPTPLLLKYFERDGLDWKVRDELRKRVTFRTMNLAAPWPSLGTLDVVFLRNVMIYFDVPTKRSILAGIRRVLRPGGWLFLGSAESTLGLDDGFERVTEGKAVVYRNRKD